MIILGIDPGLATTGYGIIKLEIKNQKLKIINFGCIKTSPNLPFAKRLEIISDELEKIIKKNKPDKVGMEKIFFAKNAKTAMQVGEARGVITLGIIRHQIPLVELTPLQVKQALTGYGQASKQQIQKMVKMILSLKDIPRPDDAADALAIAITASGTKDEFNSCPGLK